MSNILTRIVSTKAEHIAQLKLQYPETKLSPKVSTRSLFEELSSPNTSFILECKKASPSKGLIRENFDLGFITSVYRKYAGAVSVLTDEQFFQGSFSYLAQVRQMVDQPVICKDFFVDEYQIKLAAHHGADAILLMLSVLDDAQYTSLSSIANQFKLDILTEVSNQEELERAVKLDAKIIGINNRNLRDLSTNLATTEALAPNIPEDRVIISESGIYTPDQVKRLSPLVNGFLVGSSLMAEEDLDLACRTLIFGHNKVCGITRIEDSSAIANAGASYAGLIFAEKSPRCISFKHAQAITEHHQKSHLGLRFVGVFVNQSHNVIIKAAQTLSLYAVQLHGCEEQTYIDELRALFDKNSINTKIWKAISVDTANNEIKQVTSPSISQKLYDSKSDSQFGGSGETFDWNTVIDDKQLSWLAGGLNSENAISAMQQGFFGLDFNSGLESAPGIKDKQKIEQAFRALRQY
ncbi:bifunctional indole-3-glycerol-phosphate synthase TrpC/phosphoribosylanthranilate isomerase TrpF [Parashewanella spongiae]|uniref:Multifunctional fusion protein n=1 Tax=Parashewanella spongiae TaxID=342950 RepID=A0A3A6U618_9GAMM|nr:bifunctional indole-3-glycerol-phosphate synthase TrpC/phosphoribosylanthranilate isomerase TrpF [Parashewanella spongiae]MCL1076741.1 bifunctional indole-3-glycerol-phosphate synthase TrpC/phosphoribosylanthranilate isomerase TrpF [Parashewanella spongiae]RJY19482.1 bifunctional indole-3-glycerol-phosphate synthase TrpC/phosphoribosylanthranilate isomerase TrpF [Parashewanella spongiae]